MANGLVGLAVGASVLGLVHGLAPGHGWAIAASYALDKPNKWVSAAASSLILGVGHLISSIAMVVVYFAALSYFDLTQIGWMNYVAGALLIALGVRQYFSGHGHDHGDHAGHDHDDHSHGESHPHDHGDSHDHPHDNDHERSTTRFARLRRVLPLVGESGHSHAHDSTKSDADRGLYGMVALAFALGFAHNEEFDIIAICTGSSYCLVLMVLYSVAVIVSLVGVTLLLVAGYQRYEDRLEGFERYLPTITAAILVVMGVGFIIDVF